MAVDVMQQRWVAKDGSIFVEKPAAKKFETQAKPILVQDAIAFNVGKEVAEHVVRVHNAQLVK